MGTGSTVHNMWKVEYDALLSYCGLRRHQTSWAYDPVKGTFYAETVRTRIEVPRGLELVSSPEGEWFFKLVDPLEEAATKEFLQQFGIE